MMDYIRQLRVAGRRALRERILGEPRESERRRRASSRWSANLEPLERRELLATIQNFNVLGTGTPYTPQQFGNPPGPTVVAVSSTNSVMQLASGVAAVSNQNNQISFNLSDAGTYNQVNASFDFRIIPSTGPSAGRGNGLSFALLNTANYGSTGAAIQSPSAEKALFSGSLGIGFDTTQGPGDPSDNFVVVSFDAAPIQSFPIAKTVLDLASGSFITAAISVDFVHSTVSFALAPTGSATPAYSNSVAVAGLAPYESRVNFTGTAVSTLATMNLDNVDVQYVGFRQPGTISFRSSTYSVDENTPGKRAQIDIVRTGGSAGSITIGFVAADGTGRNGVNYEAVSGDVPFGEGVTLQTVSIPIIDDHLDDGNKTVKLYISNLPTLTAPLGSPIVATLTIVNTDLPAPTVSSKVQLVYAAHTRMVTAFRLQFSQPMDRTSAQTVSNYEVLLPPAQKHGPVRVVSLSQAVLDPSGLFVTLYRANLGQHLTKLVQIVVRGKPSTGLRGANNGTFLAGTGGVSGTDAVLTVSV